MKKTDRRVVMAESDSHAGHKLGLCNPEAVILNGEGAEGTPHLGKFQRYMWNLRNEYINSIKELAGKDPVIHIHGGDITQGLKYKEQLISTELSDHHLIAASNMDPIYKIANVTTGRLIAGTSSHVFGAGSAEILIAELLRGRYPGKDIRPLAHALVDIGGVVIDVAHHGPGAGIRQWTRGNVARHYLRSVMWQEFNAGGKPAKIYLRGHYHTFVWETLRQKLGGKFYESHLIVLPSWCGMTEYGRQATKSQYEVTNGMVAFEIEGGEVEVHPFYKTLDLRTKEKL